MLIESNLTSKQNHFCLLPIAYCLDYQKTAYITTSSTQIAYAAM
jgi:hypothetical protein